MLLHDSRWAQDGRGGEDARGVEGAKVGVKGCILLDCYGLDINSLMVDSCCWDGGRLSGLREGMCAV